MISRKSVSQKGFASLGLIVLTGVALLVGVTAGILNSSDSLFNKVFGGKISKTVLGASVGVATPTLQPTLTPYPTYIPPTAIPTVYVDPDPPVLCRMSAECGGGTTPLRQSECANSTCCGFPGGKWVFYKDKSQCIRDQGGTSNTQNNGISTGASVNTKEPCKFSGSGYSFDFGELTYDECKTKTDAYWASQNAVTPVAPPVANNNAELRDQCLGQVQSTYQSGLSRIQIQARALGSGSSAAEASLQREALQGEQSCKDQYPVN